MSEAQLASTTSLSTVAVQAKILTNTNLICKEFLYAIDALLRNPTENLNASLVILKEEMG